MLSQCSMVRTLLADTSHRMKKGVSKLLAWEIDHVVIFTSPAAPESARLLGLGLTEATPNTHPGQGTSCRRFTFGNAYLELLWVHNAEEARSQLTRPTRLWDRWSGRGGNGCSIGFCFRPAQPQIADVPFTAWEYRPSYLPNPHCIHIASNVDVLTEPMLCYLAFAQQRRLSANQGSSLEHAAGPCRLTRVEFVSPQADNISPALRGLVEAGLIWLRHGTRCLVELGFNGESQGKKEDCRPELPLVLCW